MFLLVLKLVLKVHQGFLNECVDLFLFYHIYAETTIGCLEESCEVTGKITECPN